MLKTLLLVFLTTCSFLTLRAQQLPLFSQYPTSVGVLNPAAPSRAYLLEEHHINFAASYRLQWTGIKNAPRTQLLQGSYLYEGGNTAFISGAYLLNDQTGPTGFTGVYGRFGVILSGDPYYGGLALGLNFGLVQYRVNASKIQLVDQGDILGSEDQSQLFPDAGAGLYWYQRMSSGWLDDTYVYGGVSVPQLMGLDLSFKNKDGAYRLKRIPHIYAQAGLIKDMGNGNVLEPGLWIKYVKGAPVHADINLRYQFQGNFWLGTGGSTAGAIHAETGFVLGENVGFDGTLRIGYSYDYYFQSFGPQVGSSHEFGVQYALGN